MTVDRKYAHINIKDSYNPRRLSNPVRWWWLKNFSLRIITASGRFGPILAGSSVFGEVGNLALQFSNTIPVVDTRFVLESIDIKH